MKKIVRKQKVDLNVRKAKRTTPSYDNLKFLKVGRYWIKKKHDISLKELEMLLFLYSENFFTMVTYNKYVNIFGFNQKLIYTLMNKGLVHKWRKEKFGEVAMYELTKKGRRIMSDFYKKLAGEDDYSVLPRKNPVFNKKTQNYTDKTMAMQMEEINRLNRESRLKRVNYDWKNPNS